LSAASGEGSAKSFSGLKCFVYKKIMFRLVFALSIALLSSCQPAEQRTENAAASRTAHFAVDAPAKLSDYWYQGKAEISRYELAQSRYTDVHPGEVIAIFVTEDFLTDRQVKNERYDNPNTTPILKSNIITRYTAGIYDYSVMSSVFTPVKVDQFPHTLKLANSVQDWCGQTFFQLNWEGEHYRARLFSYFEEEGDQDILLPAAILEDELFNRVRMGPERLPMGEVTVLPSAAYFRYAHLPSALYVAIADHGAYEDDDFPGEQLRRYRLRFPELNRELSIIYEGSSPFRIAGWIDTYPSRFDGQTRSTVAKRTRTVLSPYWRENTLNDAPRRAALMAPEG
jgi:hypothetical protein